MPSFARPHARLGSEASAWLILSAVLLSAVLQSAVLLSAVLSVGLLSAAGPTAPVRAERSEAFDPRSLPLFTEGKVYLGEHETGLYPGAESGIPPAHLESGLRVARSIQPLDREGRPDPRDGRIVAVVKGHSNATLYFTALQALFAERSGELNDRFVFVVGSVAGQQLPEILRLEGPVWEKSARGIRRAGCTPAQVQALFLHTTASGPGNRTGRGPPPPPFPESMRRMERDVAAVLAHSLEVYPNLRVAYLTTDGSRHFTGMEPHVWREAFAIKWLIQSQIEGKPGTAFEDGPGGPRRLPWLCWGPYIWDGSWDAARFRDGVHPTPETCRQVAEAYWRHLRTDPVARGWLHRGTGAKDDGATAATTDDTTRATERPAADRTPIPLCDMSAADRYKGEDGGLYGKGENRPPPGHLAAARRELSRIEPLGPGGNPDPEGKVVLLSIGMSNTTQEFSRFASLAARQEGRNPALVIVDGALGGQDVTAWAEGRPIPRAGGQTPWELAAGRLREAGATPEQVQAVWLKQAKMGPARWGEFPDHARRLADGMARILNLAKERFPNLRVTYLSSRIYAGHATIGLNPEPYAYESAFSVRWLILEQIAADPRLNHDPEKGPVRSPLILWGPYLWADGGRGRKLDSLRWRREDLAADGTHPSASGQEAVGRLLLEFFRSDELARGWFLERRP